MELKSVQQIIEKNKLTINKPQENQQKK
jgi:hypothetical protein